MNTKIKLPKKIKYEQLDHIPQEHSAFSVNYTKRDIGSGIDLTCSLFGYELGAKEALLIIKSLFEYLENAAVKENKNE